MFSCVRQSLLALAVSLAPAYGAASIIYSNIGSGFPGKSVGSQFLINNGFAGIPFTSAGSGNLSTIETAVSQGTGSAPITAGLYVDAYGKPGSILESWTIPVIGTCCGNVPSSVPAPTTLVSVVHPMLTSGTKYWFILNLGARNAVYWWYNDTGVTGGLWTHETADHLFEGNATLPAPGIQVTSSKPQPPVRTGVLSHIAGGGGWTTEINLVNPSTTAITLSIALHGDDGSPLSLPLTVTQTGVSQTNTTATVNTTLDPDSVLEISLGDQVASTVTGWADVLSTGAVGGYAIFRFTPQSGSPEEGTVPLQGTFPLTLTLPYDNRAGFVTGVALSNLSNGSASITALLWDDSGNLLSTQDFEMNANGHVSFVLPTQFPQSTGRMGVLAFQTTATGGIAGLGLRFSPFSTFTSVPIISGP